MCISSSLSLSVSPSNPCTLHHTQSRSFICGSPSLMVCFLTCLVVRYVVTSLGLCYALHVHRRGFFCVRLWISLCFKPYASPISNLSLKYLNIIESSSKSSKYSTKGLAECFTRLRYRSSEHRNISLEVHRLSSLPAHLRANSRAGYPCACVKGFEQKKKLTAVYVLKCNFNH